MSRTKNGIQGFVKGDGAAIYNTITKGGKKQANGTVLLNDGTIIFKHNSTKSGVYTIDINKGGQIYKIRVTK